MVREVVRDPMFLQRKSVEANMSDMPIAVDLLDTLKANFEGCVGMAANMIGVSKRIIAISDNGSIFLCLILKSLKLTVNTKPKRAVCRLTGSAKQSVIKL